MELVLLVGAGVLFAVVALAREKRRAAENAARREEVADLRAELEEERADRELTERQAACVHEFFGGGDWLECRKCGFTTKVD